MFVVICSGCAKESSSVIYFSENQTDSFLKIVSTEGGKDLSSSIDLKTINFVDNSIYVGANSYISFLSRKKLNWFHGTNTRTTLTVLNIKSEEDYTLTDHNYSEFINYSWNASGDKLYFASSEDSIQSIHYFDINTLKKNKLIELTDNNYLGYIRISPSGKYIAFNQGVEVFILNLENKQINKISLSSRFLDGLFWLSNDINLIISTEKGILRYDLSKKQELKLPIDGFNISISPIENLIAFVEAESDTITNIYRVNSWGEGLIKLTTIGANYAPRWSSDGNQIVYTSNKDGNWEVYIMDKDGNDHHRLTRNSVDDYYPVWLK